MPCKVVRPERWPLQLLPMSARVRDCRRLRVVGMAWDMWMINYIASGTGHERPPRKNYFSMKISKRRVPAFGPSNDEGKTGPPAFCGLSHL